MPKQSKRLLIMNILDILKRYTDENHRLSQKEIADILIKEYDMNADRKTAERVCARRLLVDINIKHMQD